MLLNEAKEIINIYNEGFLKTAGKVALVGGAVAGGVAAAPYIAKAAAPMIAKATPIISSKLAAAKSALGFKAAPAASVVKPVIPAVKPIVGKTSVLSKQPIITKPTMIAKPPVTPVQGL